LVEILDHFFRYHAMYMSYFLQFPMQLIYHMRVLLAQSHQVQDLLITIKRIEPIIENIRFIEIITYLKPNTTYEITLS